MDPSVLEAKLEQSTAAMAAMHQALIESQEAQGKLVAAERDKADAERRNVARLAREAEELKATIAGLRAADPEPRTTKLEADLLSAERRGTAAEQALDLERKARELAESRAAQYAAEAEDLASELEAERWDFEAVTARAARLGSQVCRASTNTRCFTILRT